MPMYFLELVAAPKVPGANGVGGAFVTCWIESADIAAALAAARREIDAAGWIPGRVNRAFETRREDHTNESGLEYFEQALLDKEVLVFHTYPAGGGTGA